MSGAIQIAGDSDWYKVSCVNYGKLQVQFASTNNTLEQCELYDTTGTPLLVSNSGINATMCEADGLAPGTYYIRIASGIANQLPTYTVTVNYVSTGVTTDSEPNNSYLQAVAIGLGQWVSGHVGYTFHNQKDAFDWYKITTTENGRLDLRMNPANGKNVYIELIDGDGTTLLGGNFTSVDYTFHVDARAPGLYYVRVRMLSLSKFAPYAMRVNFIPSGVANDVEDNNTVATAQVINPSDSVTGHINYKYNGISDLNDWFKINIPASGSLNCNLMVLNNNNISIELLDQDGETILSSMQTTYLANLSFPNAAQGTFYIRLAGIGFSNFAPYALSTTFMQHANDTEPNQVRTQASSLTPNTNLTNTLGYYSNGVGDSVDWHKITLPQDGQLVIAAHCIQDYTMGVYAPNGSIISNQTSPGGNLTFTRNDAAAGTYFVKLKLVNVNAYSTYQINAAHAYTNANENEPNKFAYQATYLNGYSNTEANIGYTNTSGITDMSDWFGFNFSYGNYFKIQLNKIAKTWDGNGVVNLLYQLYADTNANPIDSKVINGIGGLNKSYNGLTHGMYYLKLQRTSGYGGYTVNAIYADSASHLISVVKLKKGTTCNNGQITYAIEQGIPPYTIQLYQNGNTFGNEVQTTDSLTFNNLPPGNYYCMVNSISSQYQIKSSSKIIMPRVTGLQTTNVTASTALLTWNMLSCADGYIISYKKNSQANFTNDTLTGTNNTYVLSGLEALTNYTYKFLAYAKDGAKYYKGNYSAIANFTTQSARLASYVQNQSIEDDALQLYCNENNCQLYILADEQKGAIEIYAPTGQLIFKSETNQKCNALTLPESNGVYLLKCSNENKMIVKKVVLH